MNYQKLSYELELEIIVNDNELKELDYYFNKMEGDIETAVEAFGLLKDKMEVTKDSLADYEDHVTDLEAAYAAGDISQADYIDGLQSCYDGLYENLEALNELDEQMMEYYGETYDLALEKIEKYTSQLEHLNGVLDHYKSIMSLLGKDTDFETMGVILEGQVETTKNSYEAAQSVYNMAKE
jgi:chromosome segregation ATPase